MRERYSTKRRIGGESGVPVSSEGGSITDRVCLVCDIAENGKIAEEEMEEENFLD